MVVKDLEYISKRKLFVSFPFSLSRSFPYFLVRVACVLFTFLHSPHNSLFFFFFCYVFLIFLNTISNREPDRSRILPNDDTYDSTTSSFFIRMHTKHREHWETTDRITSVHSVQPPLLVRLMSGLFSCCYTLRYRVRAWILKLFIEIPCNINIYFPNLLSFNTYEEYNELYFLFINETIFW